MNSHTGADQFRLARSDCSQLLRTTGECGRQLSWTSARIVDMHFLRGLAVSGGSGRKQEGKTAQNSEARSLGMGRHRARQQTRGDGGPRGFQCVVNEGGKLCRSRKSRMSPFVIRGGCRHKLAGLPGIVNLPF